jgi:uncharacterized protein
MDKRIKNGLGIIGIIFTAVAVWSLVSYVDAYSKSIEPSSFRSFSVTAEGKSLGVPDIAEFSVGVLTEGGKNLVILQEENSKKTENIVSYLKENGLEDKDIRTSGYNVSPRYQYSDCYRVNGVCPPPEIVGYSIRSSISVKVRDFGKAGEILSGVVDKGANSVSGLSFKIDDEEALIKEARDEAIMKAKVKAEELAKSANFRVGRLLSIYEGSSMPFYRESFKIDGMGGDMSVVSSPVPSIEPGSQDIISSVTMTYEIR